MKITGFKMNKAGSQAVMESPGVQSALLAQMMNVREAAEQMSGEAYAVSVSAGHTHANHSVPRAHAIVHTTDAASRRDNLKNNTLLKAFGHGSAKTKGRKK